MKPIISFIICVHFFLAVAGQTREEQPIPVYEKVYLHIDRELYSPGDTIWFKSYLVSGISNQLLPGFKNVYVQLISTSGEVIANRLLLSVNGESNGDIALEDSLAEGQYLIRAYTKYLQNFGEESYFHQRIWVNKPKSSMELDVEEEQAPSEIEAMFFPEGGNLAYNTANHVAFKVIGTDGKGIEASGAILTQNNDTITTFSTSFLGMGRFMLMPKEDEKYFAVIDGYPESRQEITNILRNGFTLNFKDNGNEVLFTVSRNFEKVGKEKLYLEATHKGIQLFREEIELESFTTAIQISKNQFPEGISKITLLDENRILFLNGWCLLL